MRLVLKSNKKIKLNLCSKETLKLGTNEVHRVFDVDSIPTYDGDYFVKPKIEQQEIATKNLMMKDNVVIYPIPYYEVSNEKGKTIIIGE